MKTIPHIHVVFTGQPQTITDEQGTWTSSIYREPIFDSVAIHTHGLEGDRVAQPYHGGLGAAVCIHLMDHYRFWNQNYGMKLKAGNVGENFTLEGIIESEVCAGDIIRAGTARLQVSGPRVPCANLARRIGRKDWVKLTIRQNRTGFYMRVLEPGIVQPGDTWILLERLNPTGTIPAINRSMYLKFNPAFAESMQGMEGLEAWWKQQALERLEKRSDHWTSGMKDQE